MILGPTSLADFYKRAHLLLKKRRVSDFHKKIYFIQIMPTSIAISSQPVAR